MARSRVLAIVQAGGAGSRMDVLTRERPKPALPFAGVYQLVDFPMSNLHHSGIDNVWLSVQYQANYLDEEVANGRPWDLDRGRGGFRLLMPAQGSGSTDEDGFAEGNGDELFRLRDQIASAGAELVFVMSSDHVYRFDFTDAVATHLAKRAECTVVTTEVSRAEATEHATVTANRLGRVTDFRYKPSRARTGVIATEIFLYSADVLLAVLDELHRELTARPDPRDGLGDFGEHLLPRLVSRGRVYAHPLPGYWRDLGRPEAYLLAHQDLLDDKTQLFDDPGWPILARLPQRSPARVQGTARIDNSLISPGCTVAGVVRRSVLGPGVQVDAGAKISNSVVFADTVIECDASVSWSVLDAGVRIGPRARVGGRARADRLASEHITMLGRGTQIAGDADIPRGARLEPGTTA